MIKLPLYPVSQTVVACEVIKAIFIKCKKLKIKNNYTIYRIKNIYQKLIL